MENPKIVSHEEWIKARKSFLVALDRKSGKELWQADVADMKQVPTGYSGPRMIICEDRVLLSPMGSMVAMSAETGEILWTVKGKPRSGHFSLEDFYFGCCQSADRLDE